MQDHKIIKLAFPVTKVNISDSQENQIVQMMEYRKNVFIISKKVLVVSRTLEVGILTCKQIIEVTDAEK